MSAVLFGKDMSLHRDYTTDSGSRIARLWKLPYMLACPDVAASAQLHLHFSWRRVILSGRNDSDNSLWLTGSGTALKIQAYEGGKALEHAPLLYLLELVCGPI